MVTIGCIFFKVYSLLSSHMNHLVVGQGDQNLLRPVFCSPTSRTFISYLPPFSVFLLSRYWRSTGLLTFLQFDSLRDTCLLMPLDILWLIWCNYCRRVYCFTGSKPVCQSKRKFSLACLLRRLDNEQKDVKCESNIIWVDFFKSILTHC